MKEHRIVFFIALAFVGLSGIVFVAKQRRIESIEPAPATVASEDQVGYRARVRARSAGEPNPTQGARGSHPLGPDSRFRAAPDAAALLEREEAERLYEDSPAKTTWECGAILTILVKNRYGLRYLERAYNIVMQLHSLDTPEERMKSGEAHVSIKGGPYDPSNPEHVRNRTDVARIELCQALELEWPNHAEMIDEILEIAPKVPYRPLR